ncbi:MAG: tripartite tricarboxylate transporter permease [Bacillota bacterium]
MPTTLSQTIAAVLSPRTLALIALGTYGGIIVGALPGLTVTMATVLLVSLTYGMDMISAMAILMGIYAGGVYGGSWSSILLNIPGAPSAIATSFDGYPLAKRGEAGQAIGLVTAESFLGGILGILALGVGAPALAEIALKFGPHEYFLLTMFGLVILSSLSGTSIEKGILSAALGLFFGCVGMDPIYGSGRFTFGNVYLLGGLHFVPVMIGLFGLSEVAMHMSRPFIEVVSTRQIGRVVPPLSEVIKNLWLTVRCAAIGVFIGALPGVGGDIAALTSYAHAKTTVKKPSRPFGEGAYEGVIAPEVANNAAIGGALIPMITLGIPGDAVTAVLLGAMYIHGLKPGPMVMVECRSFFWVIVLSSIIANVFMLLFGIGTFRYAARVVFIKKEILMPIVVVLCFVGAYAVDNNFFHVYLTVLFGLIGYVMKRLDIPVGPMVLGLILGPIADVSLRRALILSKGTVVGLFATFLSRPISLVLLIALLWILLYRVPVVKTLTARIFRGFVTQE